MGEAQKICYCLENGPSGPQLGVCRGSWGPGLHFHPAIKALDGPYFLPMRMCLAVSAGARGVCVDAASASW